MRNVRMVQRREDLRFTLKPRQAIRIGDECVRKDLERHIALQLGVVRAVHLAHATSAQRADDVIGTEVSTRGKRQALWSICVRQPKR